MQVEAARLDLDPEADPAGTVRVAGFATAVRTSLVPVLHELAAARSTTATTDRTTPELQPA